MNRNTQMFSIASEDEEGEVFLPDVPAFPFPALQVEFDGEKVLKPKKKTRRSQKPWRGFKWTAPSTEVPKMDKSTPKASPLPAFAGKQTYANALANDGKISVHSDGHLLEREPFSSVHEPAQTN